MGVTNKIYDEKLWQKKSLKKKKNVLKMIRARMNEMMKRVVMAISTIF